MSHSKGGKPVGVRCEDLKRNGQPCQQRDGLRLVQDTTICGTHADLREREAARPTTGQPQSIVAYHVPSGADTRACSQTVRAGWPCRIKQGLKLVAGEVLCPTHLRKKRVDAGDVERSTPRKHIAQCCVCQNGCCAELEQGYVDGVLSVRQLAQHWEVPEWTVRRHIRYFRLQEQRATNALPYLGRILRAGALAKPTAADAIAAALAAFKISEGMRVQIDAHMARLEEKYAGTLVAVLDRLDLPSIYYKRAGEILEQEINRRTFGDLPDECPDSWNLEDDAPATIDTSTRLVGPEDDE